MIPNCMIMLCLVYKSVEINFYRIQLSTLSEELIYNVIYILKHTIFVIPHFTDNILKLAFQIVKTNNFVLLTKKKLQIRDFFESG